MKKYISLLLLVIAYKMILSQNNLISISSGAIIPTGGYYPKIKYERMLTDQLSTGLQINLMRDKEGANGATYQILVRTYLNKSERRGEGIYFQGAAVFGSVQYTSLYEARIPVDDLDLYDVFGDYSWVWAFFDALSDNDQYVYTTSTQKINVTGAGFVIGKQNFFNKTNFFYDINAGLKFCSGNHSINTSLIEDGLAFDLTSSKDSKDGPDDYKYYRYSRAGGIGSFFLGLGYKF